MSSEGRAFSLAPIKIQIHSVRNLSTSLSKDVSRLSNLENEISSLNHQLDWRIKERGNLHQRMDRSSRSLRELEASVRALENMIQRSMNRYEQTEDSLVRVATQIGRIDKVYENEMVKYTNTRKGTSSSSMLKTTVSTGADFIPFVGNAKSLVEAITGKDVVTRETLSTTSRIIAVTGIVGGGAVKGIAKGAVKLFSKIGGGAVKKGFKINKNTKFKKYNTNAEKGGSIDTKGTGNGYKYWNKTTEFNNVKVYQRDDIIDPSMLDARGRTNLERMKKGLAPLGLDGKSINLHHTTQRNTSSIAEVTQTFHKENSSVIHINPNTIPSGINRTEFNKWRTDYWKNRTNDF